MLLVLLVLIYSSCFLPSSKPNCMFSPTTFAKYAYQLCNLDSFRYVLVIINQGRGLRKTMATLFDSFSPPASVDLRVGAPGEEALKNSSRVMTEAATKRLVSYHVANSRQCKARVCACICKVVLAPRFVRPVHSLRLKLQRYLPRRRPHSTLTMLCCNELTMTLHQGNACNACGRHGGS